MDTKVHPGTDSSGPFEWAIVCLLGFKKMNKHAFLHSNNGL